MKRKVGIFCLLVSLVGVSNAQITPQALRAIADSALERQIAKELALPIVDKIMTVAPTECYSVMQNCVLNNSLTSQKNEFYNRYTQAITTAINLSKNLSTFLRYQTISPVQLEPLEIERNLTDITNAKIELDAVDRYLWEKDLALETVYRNLDLLSNYFESVGSGQALPLVPPRQRKEIDGGDSNWRKQIIKRQGRTFKVREFFLRTSKKDQTALADFKLPKKLKVAILNDQERLLQNFSQIKQLPGGEDWEIDTFLSPTEFLNHPNFYSYDLILMDLNLRPGGGVYLALRLREKGYKNAILAVTAYEEQSAFGGNLYNMGFDGAFASGVTWKMYDPWARDILFEKIKNYYFLKKKYGWEH